MGGLVLNSQAFIFCYQVRNKQKCDARGQFTILTDAIKDHKDQGGDKRGDI
jgi:hypothetical protein